MTANTEPDLDKLAASYDFDGHLQEDQRRWDLLLEDEF